MFRRLIGLCLVPLLLAACGGSSEVKDTPPSFGQLQPGAPEPTPGFEVGKVKLTGDDTITIDVQIARTDQQRQIGLMGRTSMPDNVGMAFVFEGEHQGGFWMKDTLIPLSIAFIDSGGEIVDILDMEPCEADPCPIYTPDAAYSIALETNIGAFDEWGIEAGDTAELLDP